MLDPIIDLLNSRTPVYPPFGSILVIAGLFGLAWLVARSSGWVAMRVLAWHERRHSSTDLEATGKMVNLKRRETLVSIIKRRSSTSPSPRRSSFRSASSSAASIG